MKRKNLVKAWLFITLSCALISCGGADSKVNKGSKLTTETKAEADANTAADADKQKKEEEERQAEEADKAKKKAEEEKMAGLGASRLTGLPIDKEKLNKRPIAFMINNLKPATPQSGLSSASIIYEAPVEGYITRFMAIFDDLDGVEKIGSLRSARTYFVRYASEFDAYIVHVGQAYNAKKLLNSDNSITELYKGEPIFRTKDKKPPHNCFTSDSGLKKYFNKNKKLRTTLSKVANDRTIFLFADKDNDIKAAENVGVAKKIDLTTVYHINKPYFEYDSKNKVYNRTQYGQLMKDPNNGKALEFKNVIIAFTDGKVFDNKGRWDIREKGKGTGYYFTNGKYKKINWQYVDGRTCYFDSLTDEEIEINKGKTFVCVAINNRKDRLKIS